jgi:hypothetical protein
VVEETARLAHWANALAEGQAHGGGAPQPEGDAAGRGQNAGADGA